jgi:hypothetical protein
MFENHAYKGGVNPQKDYTPVPPTRAYIPFADDIYTISRDKYLTKEYPIHGVENIYQFAEILRTSISEIEKLI